MRYLIYLFLQMIVLLFLLAKDKNDGEKYLFKRQQWKPSDVVFIIVSMTIFLLALIPLMHYLSLLLKISLYDFTKLYYPYSLIWFLTLVLIVVMRRRKQGFRALGFKREKLMKCICIGIGVTLLFFSIQILIRLFIKHMKPDFYIIDPSLYRKYFVSPFSIYLHAFASILWGPIVEESLYRGIMYSPYRKKYGPMIAIIITSLLFTFGHFEAKGEGILIGVVWGLLFERTESIVTPLAAHSSYNLLWFLTEIYVVKSGAAL
jgi:membrane protease YdiL (CAAX protease family)